MAESTVIRGRRRAWIWRSLFYFGGLWFLSLGTAFTIQAYLGVAPWDVLSVALAKVTSLSVGVCNALVGGIILGVTYFLNPKRLQWGTFMNLLLVSVFLDFIFHLRLIPQADQLWEKWLWLLIGIIVLTLGQGLYIAAEFGSGPRDGLTLELSEQSGMSIRVIRTLLEVTALSIGWLLGGPVSIGTLVISLSTGPFLQFFLKISQQILRSLTMKQQIRRDG